MRRLKLDKKIRLIKCSDLNYRNLDNKKINLIDVPFNQKKAFGKISNKSNNYIKKWFNLALNILNKKLQISLLMVQSQKNFF